MVDVSLKFNIYILYINKVHTDCVLISGECVHSRLVTLKDEGTLVKIDSCTRIQLNFDKTTSPLLTSPSTRVSTHMRARVLTSSQMRCMCFVVPVGPSRDTQTNYTFDWTDGLLRAIGEDSFVRIHFLLWSSHFSKNRFCLLLCVCHLSHTALKVCSSDAKKSRSISVKWSTHCEDSSIVQFIGRCHNFPINVLLFVPFQGSKLTSKAISAQVN